MGSIAQTRSRRGRIMDALISQLSTITVANGYAQEVMSVSTDVKTWDAVGVGETPILYVLDQNTKYTYHAGPLTERTWTVNIFGIMKQKSQDEMEELIADIEDCLMSNVTLYFPLIDSTTNLVIPPPGPVSHIRIREIITDNQLFSQIDGSQLFKVTLDLIYTALIGKIR